jgi:deazaflavin-dependent oxidoreductase (nitroreductase family)
MAATRARSMRYRREAMPAKPRTRRIPGPVKLLGLCLVGYALYHRTRWYREGNRLFYASGRPNRAGKAFGDFWVKVSNAGLGPEFFVALETVGHKTGRRSSIPLVVADHDGAKYLVSMLGQRSPWVHNVRAAGGRAVLRHGERREVRLVELPAAERAPIIKAYLARAAGGRPHIPVRPDAPLSEFEAIAADYPVFRIEPFGVVGQPGAERPAEAALAVVGAVGGDTAG